MKYLEILFFLYVDILVCYQIKIIYPNFSFRLYTEITFKIFIKMLIIVAYSHIHKYVKSCFSYVCVWNRVFMCMHTVYNDRYSSLKKRQYGTYQNWEVRAGGVGKWASSAPMLSKKRPVKLLPSIAGMLDGANHPINPNPITLKSLRSQSLWKLLFSTSPHTSKP